MNFLELMATLGIDKKQYEQGLKDAESQGRDSGSKISSALGSAAKIGLAGLTAAVAAGATAVGVLGKQAISAYASYEQLEGGIAKLYGNAGQSLEQYAQAQGKSIDEVKNKWMENEKAANMVMNNAQEAFRTAGMSANEYMETATQFSASLLNSLSGDSQEAARVTDVAMRAISDNVNTFGSDMESVSMAFKGFSKQNYTMLDNLKLGYGGTKEEMERLIADANEWGKANGEASDLSIDSFADVVQAIQQIQEKQQIAGTTAREAATTIEGSMNMVKGAWANVLAQIASGSGDLGSAIVDLKDSIIGFTDESGEHVNGLLDNLVPRISMALEGIGTLITEVAPVIVEQIPTLVSTILPSLLDGAVSLVVSIASVFPDLLLIILNAIPPLINTVVEKIKGLFSSGFDTSKLTEILDSALNIIMTLADGLIEALPTMIPAIVGIITDLVLKLTEPDMLNKIIQAGLDLIVALALGIVNALPQLIQTIPLLISNLLLTLSRALPQILEAGFELLIVLGKGIIMAIPNIVAQIPVLIGGILNAIIGYYGALITAGADLIGKIKEGFFGTISGAAQWGRDLIDNFIAGIKAQWDRLKKTVSDVARSIKDLIGFSEPKKGPLSNFHTYAPDMMDLFMQGINDNKSKLLNTVTDAFDFENLITTPGTIDGAFSVNGGASGLGANVYNITFNQPMESPIDVARTIREEAQYGLLGG